MTLTLELTPIGETAIRIAARGEFPSDWIVRLDRALRGFASQCSTGSSAIIDVVPCFDSVTVYYDVRRISFAEIERRILDLAGNLPEYSAESERKLTIFACFDPQLGLDITRVAAEKGMTTSAVVDCFCSAQYRVRMLGFLPGFAYMEGVPQSLQLPRLAEPRTQVPAGSVAIAQEMAGIYPQSSPGGWNILAQTPSIMFSVDRDPPTLLLPGDIVQFQPIARSDFERLRQKGVT